MNAEGKLRIHIEGHEPMSFFATIDQLKADPNWRSRVETRPSQFGEGKFFAVLMGSEYTMVAV